MKYIEFTTNKKSVYGLPHKICFPVNKIEKLETYSGSENVYLKVNDIEVKGSYFDLLNLLKVLEDEHGLSDMYKEFKVY